MADHIKRQTRNAEPEHRFVFETCCCCVPLRTGCLILAYLYLLGTIGVFINTAVTLSNFVDLLRYGSSFLNNLLGPYIACTVLELILLLVALPFCVLLLIGLHKHKSKNVKTATIFKVVTLVLNVLLQIGMIAGGLTMWETIVLTVLGIVFDIYFILMMRSQYYRMREGLDNLPSSAYRH